jgi:GNAT superfamily N-acetyltransferase
MDERQKQIDAHRSLVDEGLIEPVTMGRFDEEQAWVDCDTACLAEHRLGDATDPRALDAARRVDWIARATTERPWPPSTRTTIDRCYWLLDSKRRIGATALSVGGGWGIRVGSLYLYPDQRGRGYGRRFLHRAHEAFGKHGFSLRLETCWCWQRNVRLYLGMGMLVRMWKRELEFFWDDGPEVSFTFVEDRAAIRSGDRDVVWATRDGDRLSSFESISLRGDGFETVVRVKSTFSLALAMNGWPLVQAGEEPSPDDCGPPEALASRIQIWEAWERSKGWNVDAPRIPGLAYPTWVDLERRWKAVG